ncbi:MAG: PilZ domain-containing protein [Aquisalimonadaceae bacterium]
MMEYSAADATPGHLLETNPTEIAGLLQTLVRRPGSAALWLNAGRARMTVQLEAVELDNGNGRLLLRMPADAQPALEAATDEDAAVCVMNLPDCSIRFACGRPELLRKELTVAVSMPESVYRLSRRSGFRVPLPSSACLHVGTADGEHDGQSIEALDLSLGGLGLLAGQDYAAVRQLGECVLELPDGPRVEADLRVCNRAPFMRLNGEQGVRLGLAFLGLPPVVRVRLRRYLEALESGQA